MIEIITQPTRSHRDQVLSWLRENRDEGSHFYCNKEMIEQGFDEGFVHCVIDRDSAVAFVLFSLWRLSKASEIEIMEVHPAHRGRGYGTLLTKHIVNHLRSTGAKAAYLECSLSESESFWRAQGFITYVAPRNDSDKKIRLQWVFNEANQLYKE